MKLYFDTSALIKKYISEVGSENVDKLLFSATKVYISSIGEIESVSAFRRLLLEKEISPNEYHSMKKEVIQDFLYFGVINISIDIKKLSIKVIDKYQLKSLDSIHLGTAISIKNEIDYFVSCDKKLLNVAKKEGLKVVNPRD
mgnify:CR=1 FL=1